MKKSITQTLSCLMILVSCLNLLQGQVNVEGSVSNIQDRNILVSIYSEGSHQLVPVGSDGKFTAELPRFEECLVSVYSAQSQAKTYSINTDLEATEPIKLFVTMAGGTPSKNDFRLDGPEKRYTTDGYAYTTDKFNLDNVKDKPKFATLMSQLSVNLKSFYQDKKIPEEQLGVTTNSDDAQIRKSEHRLGQEIYALLNKKRLQDQKWKDSKAAYESDSNTGLARCEVEYTYLKSEATFIKTSYELAKAEFEKEKLIIRRKENSGRPANSIKMIDAKAKMMRLEKENEIAGITLINKQADCWELDAQAKLDLEMQKGEARDQSMIAAKRLEINNVRMTSRLQNAKRLYKQYNLLANDLTGRDRVVELANAQKYISQQEEIKLYQAENVWKKWQIKNESDQKFAKQVALAKDAFLKQREWAYLAEMAYLEHMWHLRETPSVKSVLDDIFARQNDLLDIVQTNRPEVIETVEETATITDAEVLSKIKIESNTRDGGRSKKLTFDQDYYEIVESGSSRKYYKNGAAITRITYEFETKRKFGEILENVKEEEQKTRLWDLFKKRIQ